MSLLKNSFFGFINLFCLSLTCAGQNYYDQGFAQYKKGNDSSAVTFFTRAIESNQNVAKSYLYRGAAKTFLGKYYEASLDFQSSLINDSSDYLTYYYYGRLYAEQGFFSTALRYYDRSLKKNSKDPEVFNTRSVARCKEDDIKGAYSDINFAIKLDSSKGDFYMNRGVIHVAEKDFLKGIDDFSTAIKLGCEPQAYINRAAAFHELGKYKEAIIDYTKGIEKVPDPVEGYYYRGLAYKVSGELKKACDDFYKSAQSGFKLAQLEFKKSCDK